MTNKYLIIAFGSRNDTMTFYEKYTQSGGRGVIINTPKRVSTGCGISVKIPSGFENTAYRVLRVGYYRSYIGIFQDER